METEELDGWINGIKSKMRVQRGWMAYFGRLWILKALLLEISKKDRANQKRR